MARQKKVVDWLTLELDYRAGVKSMRLLSHEYGISKSRIGQVAEEREWSRDLAAKIRSRAQSNLDSSVLDCKLDTKKKITEYQIVEVNAQIQTDIILRHRAEIARARALAIALLEELEIATNDNILLRDLANLMKAPRANGIDKLNEIYNRVIGFPSRVEAMKKLSDSLKVLVALEREAFGIDRRENEFSGAIEAVIKRVMAKRSDRVD